MAGVSVKPKTNNLEIGDTRQLNVEIDPGDADNKNVDFTSDDESIASIDNEGIVTAIAEGETIITVTTEDGNHKDTATVNVTDPDPDEEPEE